MPVQRLWNPPVPRFSLPPAAFIPILAAFLFALPAGRASAACSGDLSGSGSGTYYTFTPGTGLCSFIGDDSDSLVAAINPTDYANSEMCGRYLHVTGPLGSVDVRIVDECPSCAAGDVDFNEAAFRQIANPLDGRVDITWYTIPDPTTGNVQYYISAASNPWYVQLQPRHGRYGIAALQYDDNGNWVSVPRVSYNYFIITPSSMITDPLEVRVTDVNGATITQAGIPLAPGATFDGSSQFPLCEPAAVPARAATGFVLRAPVPNPFSPATTLSFDLARGGDVRLGIYDTGGRLVRTLVSGHMGAGSHQVEWNGLDERGRPVASGMYFCRLTSGSRTAVQRLVHAE